MSDNRFKFEGLEALKVALRTLPERLTQQAAGIVTNRAYSSAGKIVAGYPLGKTGNLRKGVKVEPVQVSGGGVIARVRSVAKHAHLFEYGTQARHTDEGWNRGVMPAQHVFVPVVVRERRQMIDELVAMVVREGIQVNRG